MTEPATLSNWLAYDIVVSLHCEHCHTATPLPIGELVERCSEDYPVAEIRERARCKRCGNRAPRRGALS
jgi:hypothetical protein